MGRFVSPGSLRYGKTVSWKPISESIEGFWKSKVFFDYLEGLLTKYLLLEEGIIFGDIGISYKEKKVLLSVSVYDRSLELLLKEGSYQDAGKVVEQNLLKKLAFLKCIIEAEGEKYYNVPVKVEFKGMSLRSLSGEMLAKYITNCLEQGISLQAVLKVITRELIGRKSRKDKAEQGEGLSHRMRLNYSEEQKVFTPYYVGNLKLRGFRVDCSGRFSRKQRASKKSIREGIVSLGGYHKDNYIDFGFSRAILEYGACGVKVWLSYEQKETPNKGYIFKY